MLERAQVGEPGLQPKAPGNPNLVRRAPLPSFDDQHADRIDDALTQAKGAKEAISTLRAEIDWDRANLLQLTHAYRDALKLALQGRLIRVMAMDGMASCAMNASTIPIRPTLMMLAEEACREIDLDAEHAG